MIDDQFTDMVHGIMLEFSHKNKQESNRTGLRYTEHTQNPAVGTQTHVSCTAQTVALVADSFKKIKM